MRGIVLSGGAGTRLFPLTKSVSKQLLPIFNKPMVYFPISTLMMAGIRDILIITTPRDKDAFMGLLGDGSKFGLNLQYAEQAEPKGLAEAFIIGEEFIGKSPVCLILGDNIFHGAGFTDLLADASSNTLGLYPHPQWEKWSKATVFGYYVNDPERYGVAEFNENGTCISLEEKPKRPKSNYAVPGLYFYPNDVVAKAKMIQPSERGELEITTLNQMYLSEGRLNVIQLPRGFAWLDTGTFDSLSDASNYVETIEKRTGQQIACLEEIAYTKGWIDRETLLKSSDEMKNNEYGKYLLKIAK